MRRLTTQDRGKLIRAQIEQPPAGETKLHALLRLLWSEVDPAPFSNWRHLHAVCEALHSVLDGDTRNLVINIPPGSGKSIVMNVFFPMYIWLVHDPAWRMLFASYSQKLSTRDANKCIELLRSPVVRAAFPEFSLGPEKERKAAGDFTNAHMGQRMCTTVPAGQLIGEHFHVHTYDDPIKPDSIIGGVGDEFQTSLNAAYNWVGQTAATRFVPMAEPRRIMMMQRLHDADPAGRVLKEGGWDHLCLPEEYVKNAKWIIGDFTKRFEWREKEGELLCPLRRGPKELARDKKNMASAATVSAQLQQNPTPDSGGILEKKPILQHAYRTAPDISKMQLVGSFDFSFKKKAEGSRVGGQLWGQLGGKQYLLDASAGHMGFREGKEFLRSKLTNPMWQGATFLVEDKANGTAIEDDLKDEFPMIQLFEPGNTPKLERMLPFIEPIRNGEVLYPHPELYPWAEEVIDEIVKVPRGQYDEHWDCTTQALMYLKTGARNYSQGLKDLRALGLI